MHGWAVFVVVVIVLAVVAGAGFFGYTRIYKQRQSNSSFPSPAPSGITDWVKDKWSTLRNPKSSSGAGYEGAGYSAPGGGFRSGARRGNALDPDEAWDTRVGNEADVYGPGGYYEEQELGLHQPTAYSGGSAGGFRQTSTLGVDGTDRSRSKSPGGAGASNPFGDENAASSLRSVSPRPDVDGSTRGDGNKGKSNDDRNPAFERRSMFREEV